MKLTRLNICLIGILTVVSLGITYHPVYCQTMDVVNKEAIQKSEESISETFKSIHIMSNVINDLFANQFGDEYKEKGYFYEGCRGYWIPESGILFMLSVEFPVHIDEQMSKDREDLDESKDLWEKYESTLEKRQKRVDPDEEPESSEGHYPDQHRSQDFAQTINQLKVHKLQETLLGAIAKYGHRFDGFQPNDTITIIVNGKGQFIPFNDMIGQKEMGMYGMSKGGMYGGSVGSNMYGSMDMIDPTQGPPMTPSVMIMQVKFHYLPSDSDSLDDFYDNVQITTYSSSSAFRKKSARTGR